MFHVYEPEIQFENVIFDAIRLDAKGIHVLYQRKGTDPRDAQETLLLAAIVNDVSVHGGNNIRYGLRPMKTSSSAKLSKTAYEAFEFIHGYMETLTEYVVDLESFRPSDPSAMHVHKGVLLLTMPDTLQQLFLCDVQSRPPITERGGSYHREIAKDPVYFIIYEVPTIKRAYAVEKQGDAYDPHAARHSEEGFVLHTVPAACDTLNVASESSIPKNELAKCALVRSGGLPLHRADTSHAGHAGCRFAAIDRTLRGVDHMGSR